MSRKKQRKNIADKRIAYLESLANTWMSQKRIQDAQTAITHAKKLAKSNTIRITHIQQTTCKDCNIPLWPGITSKVRIRNQKRIIHCTQCASVKRLGF